MTNGSLKAAGLYTQTPKKQNQKLVAGPWAPIALSYNRFRFYRENIISLQESQDENMVGDGLWVGRPEKNSVQFSKMQLLKYSGNCRETKLSWGCAYRNLPRGQRARFHLMKKQLKTGTPSERYAAKASGFSQTDGIPATWDTIPNISIPIHCSKCQHPGSP